MESELINVIQFHDEAKQLTPKGKKLCEEDLISIGDKVQYKEWDNSLPILRSYVVRKYEDVSKQSIIDTFLDSYEIFRAIDMNNVLIAGGCIVGIIEALSQGKEFDPTRKMDIDLFLYGLTVEEATKKMYYIGDQFMKKYQYGQIYKSRNAITFYQKGQIEIQVILRIYDSPSQILHGFDLGSSMIGLFLSGKQDIVTTKFGLYCIEHRINVAIPKYRSTTYERRLGKYFYRGYNIVMPSIDLQKMKQFPKQYRFDHFTIDVQSVNDNIIVGTFYSKNMVKYDYGGIHKVKTLAVSESKGYRFRIVRDYITKGNNFYVQALSAHGNSLYRKEPQEQEGITEFRLKQLLKPLDINYKDVMVSCPMLLRKGVLNLKMVERLGSSFNMDKMMKMKSCGINYHQINEEFCSDFWKATAVEFNKDYEEFCQIRWLVDNPESQLCGSFNPAFSSEKEWYKHEDDSFCNENIEMSKLYVTHAQ